MLCLVEYDNIMTAEETDKLFQMYKLDCEAKKLHADISDFLVWVEEEYPDVDL